MKYSFIAQNKKAWPIDLQCRVLGVKRNGYYRYEKQLPLQSKDLEREELLEWIKKVGLSSEYSYGSRRMKESLNTLGYRIGRNRTRKLMKEAQIYVRSRKKYKVTTHSQHKQPVFENLLNREFKVGKADRIYVSDITYVWTMEGWLYLAVVMDLFSRKVVGWSMGSRIKSELVCDALKMALGQRKPLEGIIVHSDRGKQYASHQYREVLKAHGGIGSMSRKGDCWDNSVIESFFKSLKQERLNWKAYQTRFEAWQDILNYITMFYNSCRLHSYLGYKSPNQFEMQMKNN